MTTSLHLPRRARFVSRIRGIALLTAAVLLTPGGLPRLHAQGGPLAPPGAPAPTMRSLQEIWDRIGVLEEQNAAQKARITALQNQGPLLHYASGGWLPWVITTVDSPGTVGGHTSLAFGPDGQPAISYYDDTNDNLNFARYDGVAWNLLTADDDFSADIGKYTSLAFGPDGQPSISYYDVTNGDLKFARFNGYNFSLSVVDRPGDVGAHTSLAFGPDGLPAISCFDATNGDLKFARMGTFGGR